MKMVFLFLITQWKNPPCQRNNQGMVAQNKCPETARSRIRMMDSCGERGGFLSGILGALPAGQRRWLCPSAEPWCGTSGVLSPVLGSSETEGQGMDPVELCEGGLGLLEHL